MFDLNSILRNNIKKLKPYSSARDDFSGDASVWIDANENPYNTNVNRYPDPHQRTMKGMLAKIKGVKEENLFVGNGSDEVIDLLYRIVCEPGKSNAILLPPTYGMYGVAGEINDVELRKVALNEDFSINVPAVMEAIDSNTRLIFICSPNNPSGTVTPLSVIKEIASKFSGIVIVDEAYVDFMKSESAVSLLGECPNIYVVQTLSKAWGMAGARLGIGIASKEIQDVMAKVKAPYNVNVLSQRAAIENLANEKKVKEEIQELIAQRKLLAEELAKQSAVLKVINSEANFLLVKFADANKAFDYLLSKGVVTRNRSKEKWCDGCIRITVGTPKENEVLIEAIKQFA